jgi:hypothetical protein
MRWRTQIGVCGLVTVVATVTLAVEWWRTRNDLDVPARAGWRTCVSFASPPPWPRPGPPPWRGGNCFSLAPVSGPPDGPGLFVVNMHVENFERVVRDLGLETVRVHRIEGNRCLVTDPRIPRSWLLTEPCTTCLPPHVARELTETHPEWFRPKEAAAEAAGAPDRGGKK